MQDSVREVLAYLKTARELEIGLMKLDKLEKHSNWKILQLEGKAYPEFQPPNARIEQERADAKSKARAIGAVFGGIAGFVFEFVEEWRIVEASGSPLAWFGNLVVFWHGRCYVRRHRGRDRRSDFMGRRCDCRRDQKQRKGS